MRSSTLTLTLCSLAATAFARPAESVADVPASYVPDPSMIHEPGTGFNVRALPTTENGLSGACKAVTVIFARGTGEDGNVGTVVGPQVFEALRARLGTSAVTVQGVTYSATVIGYLEGGDPAGTTEMLRLINLASTQCSSTKIVLSGYSQGAQLLHKAARSLSAAVTRKVAAVVLFGDPNNGQAVGTISNSLVLNNCHVNDIICTGRGGAEAHLTYGEDAEAASNFIAARV
ncbi:hypothetical protein HYALB_00009100 [Hymenoscyphus albidus]|uniref:cutinase n=1 Tax=Hymenoscyphus albidus TaxID=595503 RepID=A0A9N9LK08_9HELO|nr:hypothetical protein HYALB_00009100 [Hymenoscyphus albidus]